MHAPKIRTADRALLQGGELPDADEAVRRARVLGSLWAYVSFGHEKSKSKRIILEDIHEAPADCGLDSLVEQLGDSGRVRVISLVRGDGEQTRQDTIPVVVVLPENGRDGAAAIRLSGGCAMVGRIKVEGERSRPVRDVLHKFSSG